MISCHKLTCIEGSEFQFRIKNIEDDLGNELVMSNYDDIQIQVRKESGSTVIMEAWKSQNQITVVSNTELIVTFDVPILTETKSQVYRWDIDFVKTSGKIFSPSKIRGEICILKQITNVLI